MNVHFQYDFVDNWLKEMHCQRLRRLDRFLSVRKAQAPVQHKK
jgi:hypothetical protein